MQGPIFLEPLLVGSRERKKIAMFKSLCHSIKNWLANRHGDAQFMDDNPKLVLDSTIPYIHQQ